MDSKSYFWSGATAKKTPGILLVLGLALTMLVGISEHVMAVNQAEVDTTRVDLNLMKAPSSPAFTLLGVEPASVPRPSNSVDLVVSIVNATDGLNSVPEDFAVEFSPYWIFWDSKFYGADSDSASTMAKLWTNITHSATFSFGTLSRSDTIAGETEEESTTIQSTSLGIGVNFTVLAGGKDTVDTDYVDWYNDLLDTLRNAETYLSGELKTALSNDALTNILDKRVFDLAEKRKAYRDSLKSASSSQETLLFTVELSAIESEIEHTITEKELRTETLKGEILKGKQASFTWIRKHVSEQPNRRIGWTMDVAGGIVVDFPGREVQDGKLTRWGAWATLGYNWSDPKISVLGIFRALGNDQTSDNVSYDFGGRLVVDKFKKVSFSVEGLHRSFPERESGMDKSTWRVAFQADYAIAKNKSISVTLGRDFSGERSGNLISLVNLVMGFGSNRSIEN